MSDAGWHIDERTLLPVIDDEEVFRTAHSEDPALDALVSLWSGRPRDAEHLLRDLLAREDSSRFCALLADSLRDQGHHEEAITTYRALVSDSIDSAREAVMRQHLGKAYFVAGDVEQALREFTQALDLRIRINADSALIESSRLAVARATVLAATRRT